jgi:hypothetical protein
LYDRIGTADATSTGWRRQTMRGLFAGLQLIALVPLAAVAEICPEKNILYWQAFTPGGESDLSARHQQVVLKKKCPANSRTSGRRSTAIPR